MMYRVAKWNERKGREGKNKDRHKREPANDLAGRKEERVIIMDESSYRTAYPVCTVLSRENQREVYYMSYLYFPFSWALDFCRDIFKLYTVQSISALPSQIHSYTQPSKVSHLITKRVFR